MDRTYVQDRLINETPIAVSRRSQAVGEYLS